MKSRALLTFTVGFGLLAANAVAAAKDYELTRLVSPYPGLVNATDINNKGEVTGWVDDPNGTSKAFLLKNGNYIDLHAIVDPNAVLTVPSAINNRSAVIGERLSPEEGWKAFLVKGDTVSAVDVVPNEEMVIPTDINDRGQVIGETIAQGGEPTQAFIWKNDEASILDPLPGAISAFPEAINDRGVVVGYSLFQDTRKAVIWQDASVMALGGLLEETNHTANDINNRGQVLVSSSLGYFVWYRGEYQALEGLDGGFTRVGATDINNRGWVVGGTYNIATGQSLATLWRRGEVIDLNDLVDPQDPLAPYVTLVNATRINDHGDILARGRDSREPNLLHTYLLRK